MNLDRQQEYIFSLEGVLDDAECDLLIARIEKEGPRTAPVNTPGGAKVKLTIRNNERVMLNDAKLAAKLFERVKDRVPAEIHGMNLCGANELLRCYRYKPGMRFAPHADGAFVRDENEQSWYTFIVYLNHDFEGGETVFIVEPEVSISPKKGKGLFFQHPLIHEGSVVTEGVKYVLRTDLMYRSKSER